MEEFDLILDRFHHSKSIESMNSLCSILKNSLFDSTNVANLTRVLAYSGDILEFSHYSTADIPSTGGPSSLSTIFGPLMLKDYFAVPKLGIVGRPAGGIDVLSQIDGYNLKLSKKEIYSIIDKGQYCHFISDNRFAPLDNILFRYRSDNNFKDIPSLVIASLLSKKLAVGVQNVCLDIRYSSFGNFGTTLEQSKKFSHDFKSVADILNIYCTFYFSNNNKLLQPYIGRGESLLAISDYFSGVDNMWLKDHIEKDIKIMVESVLGYEIIYHRERIINNFFENIKLQGGRVDSFNEIACKTRNGHIYELKANRSGALKIDILRIRDLIVKIQNKYITNDDEFADPCGVIFFKNHNENISKNEVLLTYRVLEGDLDFFKTELNEIIIIE